MPAPDPAYYNPILDSVLSPSFFQEEYDPFQFDASYIPMQPQPAPYNDTITSGAQQCLSLKTISMLTQLLLFQNSPLLRGHQRRHPDPCMGNTHHRRQRSPSPISLIYRPKILRPIDPRLFFESRQMRRRPTLGAWYQPLVAKNAPAVGQPHRFAFRLHSSYPHTRPLDMRHAHHPLI